VSRIATNRLLDFGAIRRDYPLPDVIGASVRLVPAGNGWKGLCPFHPDRSPSLSIHNGPRGVRWLCFAGCGGGDVIDFVCKLHRVGVGEAVRILGAGTAVTTTVPKPAGLSSDRRVAQALAVFGAAVPSAGTLGETYLASRGIPSPFPPDIRFGRLRYPGAARMPSLVCGVQNVAGAIIGVQRIFLAPDGSGKADVPQPKLSLGRISGGAIRVGEPDATGVLAVCEGPEDGLSLRQLSGLPVWVAAGVGNLPKMLFPPSVRKIVIGADNDERGLAGARAAADAYTKRGLIVSILRPLPRAKDWNDELMMEIRRGC
jgi:DNA primase